MDLSMFVIKVYGLVFLAVGVGMLSRQIVMEKLVSDFEKSPALTYMGGLFALLVGALLVEHHNLWVNDWRVIVTVVGWLALVKGVLLIAFPKMIHAFKGLYKNLTPMWGVVGILLGLACGYVAYFM